jgi:hypothetical protein
MAQIAADEMRNAKGAIAIHFRESSHAGVILILICVICVICG